MRRIVGGVFATSLFLASVFLAAQAFAADMAVKAPPPRPPAPASSWTGFYVGGELGGAWAHRSVSSTANDPVAALLLSGGLGFTGEQPVSANSFSMSGVTGGAEAGYNWQVDPKWLLGIETDFNGSSLKGSGNSTSVVQGAPAVPFNQTVALRQTIDWYGTVRGRLGWLPSDNILLFVTGGFAYGRVGNSGTYTAIGSPAGAAFTGSFPGSGLPSFACVTDVTCFAGSTSQIRAGFTLGGGAEWMMWRNWSLKVEYQYVNLGRDTLGLTAVATVPGLPIPSSFNAHFRDDFHVVRAGVNYHF